MRHDEGRVRQERQLLLEGILILRQRSLSLVLGGVFDSTTLGSLRFLGLLRGLGDSLTEAFIDFFEEREVVVERLHVEVAVDVQLTIVGDGVTQTGSVVEFGTPYPVVGRIIRRVRGHPVEDRQLVERQLIGSGERLAIVEGASEMFDALPDGVLPGLIVVGIEFLVYGQVAQRLFDFSLRTRLEVHVQVAGEVPSQREATVPEELRVEGDGQARSSQVLHVTLLQLVVDARHLRIERDVLRQPVDAKRLRQRHPLRLALRLGKRFPRLVYRRIGIVQRTAPLVFALVDRCLARRIAVGVAVGEGEVGRVVRHRVTLGLDAETHVRQREVGIGGTRHGNALDGVALMGSHGVQGIVQLHVSIQRVVLRPGLFLRNRIIERSSHLHLVGEELTQFDIGGQRVGLVVVLRAGCNTILQSTEALGDNLTRQVDGGHVRQLHVQRSRGCPTAAAHHIHQAQFVDPHLTRLDGTREVAHTNHHGLHLAQRGVTHDAHLVVGTVGIVVGIKHRVTARTDGACLVARLLQPREDRKVDVHHILLGPYSAAVVQVILVVVITVGGEFQRDDILVVVAGIIVTQANEDSQLVVTEIIVVDEVVGMYKHLHALIEAQVEGGIAIDGLGLTRRQILHHHVESLLVSLRQLGLRGVGNAGDARRQHIVNWALIVIFLDVDGTDHDVSAIAASSQRLLIDTPFATYQV